jgi:signal peptidase I
VSKYFGQGSERLLSAVKEFLKRIWYMSELDELKEDYPAMRYNPTVAGIINTLQWLLIAFILALVFRAYEMEAFRIPTGSMAETLRGAHYHLRCVRCGYEYDVGGDSIVVPRPSCPSCSYLVPEGTVIPISNGDRIVVLKCIYQFCEPRRWDVVVFKNPLNPSDSFIKRLIAGPGERVEIIDGDIYINGMIARKPAKVQSELWMPVYDNDYIPSGIWLRSDRNDKRVDWRAPFYNEQGSQWDLEGNGPSVFLLDSESDKLHTISYNNSNGKSFRASYGYNDSRDHHIRPICSDLMIRYYVDFTKTAGLTGAALGKYGRSYRGIVDCSGEMRIEELVDGEAIKLASRQLKGNTGSEMFLFKFMNVDHQLILEFGDKKVKYDLGRDSEDAGERDKKRILPGVKIIGAGKLRLSHIGVFRDIHYIGEDAERAGEGRAFTLGADEYFVCGDNSPISQDARIWESAGIGNNGKVYREGTVPRDYLVGKAFFVYWSEAFRPFENLLPVVPNVGQIGFIYGGSDREL